MYECEKCKGTLFIQDVDTTLNAVGYLNTEINKRLEKELLYTCYECGYTIKSNLEFTNSFYVTDYTKLLEKKENVND